MLAWLRLVLDAYSARKHDYDLPVDPFLSE
jgi:hypothetical protein